jgi:hypothetical protein
MKQPAPIPPIFRRTNSVWLPSLSEKFVKLKKTIGWQFKLCIEPKPINGEKSKMDHLAKAIHLLQQW